MNLNISNSMTENNTNTDNKTTEGPSDYKLTSPDGDMKEWDSLLLLETKPLNPPSWDKLKETEKHRRQLLQQVEFPVWRILLHWKGTCFRALALDWMIWLPIVIFVVIRFHARRGDEAPGIVAQLEDSDIDILGGFLSFLLVLFVNQTNTRFFEMYKLSKASAGRIQDVAGLASCRLPPPAAHRLVRYMNAAHVAGYVGLGGPYTKKHFFDKLNSEYNLLTDKEARRLDHLNMDSGSAVFKELVTWCQKQVEKAQLATHVDAFEATELHGKILEFRAAMDGIYDYCDQPTHFFYIHFLALLSVLYLPLFAVDNAYSAGWGANQSDWGKEILAATIVFVQAIFVVGLRMLGQKMIDPYGDDWEDLSVMTYITTTIDNCGIILSTRDETDDDVAEEEMMKKEQEKVPAQNVV